MQFRIEVFNSVDGSCRLVAAASWLRLVCSNGMMSRETLMLVKQQHRHPLHIEQLGSLLKDAVQSAENDRIIFARWQRQRFDRDLFVSWINRDVHERWGLKAAVRVLGIATQGKDVEPAGDCRNRKPSEVGTKVVGTVPGVNAPASNLFEISQVLAWVAGQRADIAEDLEWRSDVPALMEKLVEQI